MFRIPSTILLPAILALTLLSCEHNERESTQRLVFNVNAGTDTPDFFTFPSSNSYLLVAPAEAFSIDSTSTTADSSLTPTRLQVTMDKPGSLVPSMLRALGYKVITRFEFEESQISVNHTNVADSLYVVTPGDSIPDTLYIAVRGEGLISGGENIFENVTGLFFEQSTYRIVDNSVTSISCRYEMTIEY
jgi:hypothetical protein